MEREREEVRLSLPENNRRLFQVQALPGRTVTSVVTISVQVSTTNALLLYHLVIDLS